MKIVPGGSSLGYSAQQMILRDTSKSFNNLKICSDER